MPADHNTSSLPRWQGVKYQMSCCHERAVDDSFEMNGSSVYVKSLETCEFSWVLPLLQSAFIRILQGNILPFTIEFNWIFNHSLIKKKTQRNDREEIFLLDLKQIINFWFIFFVKDIHFWWEARAVNRQGGGGKKYCPWVFWGFNIYKNKLVSIVWGVNVSLIWALPSLFFLDYLPQDGNSEFPFIHVLT